MASGAGSLEGQTLLGKLRVVREIGRGAMGVVYEVEHLLAEHRRALKVLRAELATSGEAVARMVREAGVAGSIESPRLVETFDVGRLADGSTYVLMELCVGESLRARLERETALPPVAAVEIALQVCEGLDAVHQAGIVHRDLKPENLFLVDGPRLDVKILDFGALKREAGAEDTFGKLTADGQVTGTPLYMAPEQLDAGGAIDATCDVYALGVVLYESLAGRRPFDAPSLPALLRAIRDGAHAPLGDAARPVDPELEAVVYRAMHREKAERFGSAALFRAALAPFAAAAGSPLRGLLAERFELVRCIKSGGMGAVYEVIHKETRRHRALKLMLPGAAPSEEARRRFRLEARIAADIDSEHIAETFDAGVDPETDTPFIVMELLRGEELGVLSARRGALPPAEVATYLGQAALALDRTHAAGIVHRDLKPENLFITRRDDGSPRLKILDFGVARAFGGARPAPGSGTQGPIGTPLYMAPEQLEADGTIGPATDLYALGHVAYALLAGEPYFADEARSGLYPLLATVALGAREPGSARAARAGVRLPPAFDAWFARAVAIAPADRFASASASVAALREALELGAAAPSLVEAPREGAPRSEGQGAPTLRDADTLVSGAGHEELEAVRDPQPELLASSSEVTEGALARSGELAPRARRGRAALGVGLTLGALALLAAGVFLGSRAPAADLRAAPPLDEAASLPAISSATPARLEPSAEPATPAGVRPASSASASAAPGASASPRAPADARRGLSVAAPPGGSASARRTPPAASSAPVHESVF